MFVNCRVSVAGTCNCEPCSVTIDPFNNQYTLATGSDSLWSQVRWKLSPSLTVVPFGVQTILGGTKPVAEIFITTDILHLHIVQTVLIAITHAHKPHPQDELSIDNLRHSNHHSILTSSQSYGAIAVYHVLQKETWANCKACTCCIVHDNMQGILANGRVAKSWQL